LLSCRWASVPRFFSTCPSFPFSSLRNPTAPLRSIALTASEGAPHFSKHFPPPFLTAAFCSVDSPSENDFVITGPEEESTNNFSPFFPAWLDPIFFNYLLIESGILEIFWISLLTFLSIPRIPYWSSPTAKIVLFFQGALRHFRRTFFCPLVRPPFLTPHSSSFFPWLVVGFPQKPKKKPTPSSPGGRTTAASLRNHVPFFCSERCSLF